MRAADYRSRTSSSYTYNIILMCIFFIKGKITVKHADTCIVQMMWSNWVAWKKEKEFLI